jgi:hypothetical protein
MGKKRLSKLLLVILNIIYFLAAVAILTIGSLSLSGSTVFIDLLDLIESTTLIQNILDIQELTLAPAIYLVCLGSVAVVLAFIGSCGALRGRGWVLVIFGVCKFCIVLFNLALIMWNSIVPFHGKDNVQNLMLDNLKLNYEPTKLEGDNVVLPLSNTSAYYWATMEFTEACCAAGNHTDYLEILNSTDDKVSMSCCMQIVQYKIPTTSSDLTDLTTCLDSAPEHTNYRGCIDYVMSIILTYRQIYLITAAAFIALEVLTIGLTVRVHGDRDRGIRAV